jgi:hypothetical protein
MITFVVAIGFTVILPAIFLLNASASSLANSVFRSINDV